MSSVTDASVIRQKQIAPGYYRLSLAAPEVAGAARPGQFLHVRCGNTLDPLLRRPISIHAVDREKGEVTLLYRVAGRGTALLSETKRGGVISLLGPLGTGFTLPENHERVSIVAGGIGIAPLYFLLQELSVRDFCATVFLGAVTRKQFVAIRKIKKHANKATKLSIVDEIKEMGHKVVLATDDGTVGFRATITDLFDCCTQNRSSEKALLYCDGDLGEALEKVKLECVFLTDRVYGCGPSGMLKGLCEILKRQHIPGEVSLEERMGCGVGACLSCACKTRDGEDGFRYRRACVEGPVFPVGEVVWE